jgi:exonuclease 3'-5' domain-containing protein 1
MTAGEKQMWTTTKSEERKIFDPQCGGTYEVFNVRPLSDEILQYCIQDVQFLPKLWLLYYSKMTAAWAKKVELATRYRVDLSQTATFNGKGQHMALGPWI